MKLNTIACSAAISLALIGTASAHYKTRESAAQEQQETQALNSQHGMDVADANTITGSDIKAAGRHHRRDRAVQHARPEERFYFRPGQCGFEPQRRS